MQHNLKNFLPYLIAAVIGLLLFFVAHHDATLQRGFTAYGGEVFLLFAPIAVSIYRVVAKDAKAMLKAINEVEDESNESI